MPDRHLGGRHSRGEMHTAGMASRSGCWPSVPPSHLATKAHLATKTGLAATCQPLTTQPLCSESERGDGGGGVVSGRLVEASTDTGPAEPCADSGSAAMLPRDTAQQDRNKHVSVEGAPGDCQADNACAGQVVFCMHMLSVHASHAHHASTHATPPA